MPISLKHYGSDQFYPLDAPDNYRAVPALYSHDNQFKFDRAVISCDYPDVFWVETDVDKFVKSYVDHVVEKECLAYLEAFWEHAPVELNEMNADYEDDLKRLKEGWPESWEKWPTKWKKLSLHKIPREKLLWDRLWDFGLRAVKFEHHPKPNSPEGREHAQKMMKIKPGDVLREIEKYLMKLIERAFIKVTEKDLGKMAYAHQHAKVNDKDPAMQRALIGAAELARSNYASACGGKWVYVSAYWWWESATPGPALRLDFTRDNDMTVGLSAEEMHFHWRCNNDGNAGERVRSHPLIMLVDAWLQRNYFA